MTMHDSERGTGRTTRALGRLVQRVVDGPEPRLGIYVTHGRQFDDYCFRIIARVRKDDIKQYSMSNRMILFKNGARIRFITWDDPYLTGYDRGHWRVVGYRADTPITWDHYAEDLWTKRETARNSPRVGRLEKKR